MWMNVRGLDQISEEDKQQEKEDRENASKISPELPLRLRAGYSLPKSPFSSQYSSFIFVASVELGEL